MPTRPRSGPPAERTRARERPGSGGAERVELAAERERLESFDLDLPDALARDSERLADLFERHRVRVAVEPEAQLEHILLAVWELGDRTPQGIRPEADLELLL